jgi:hypothetical protein
MATRFYLINGSVTSPPTTVRGGWEITDSIQTIPLSTVKTGGPIAVKSVSEGAGAVPNDVMMLRLVSPKLAAQTLSGTLNLTLGVKTPYILQGYYWHIHAWVTDGDTNNSGGTLVNNYREDTPTTPWQNTAQTRILALNVPLTGGAIVSDSRIVVEIGYISRTALDIRPVFPDTGKIVAPGPTSFIQLSFSVPPEVGEGIVVMVAAHSASGGASFIACNDNSGNLYSLALSEQISSDSNYSIAIYYCAKIFDVFSPFQITVLGGGNHNFVGSAVRIINLKQGLITLGNVSSNSPASPSTVPDTGGAGDLVGPGVFAAIFARILSAGSIGVHTDNIPWNQVHEELITNANLTICSEANIGSPIFASTGLRATWATDVASIYAAAFASFTRTGEVAGTGDLYYGAPAGSTDLVHPDIDVTTQAGFIEFTQNLLLTGELADVGHIVTQVAELIPLPPAQLSHEVVQVASFAPPRLNISHVVAQVAHPHPGAPTSLSHLVVQVADLPPASDGRISHSVIQVVPTVVPTLPDISGLYFLNPSKQEYHDSYYKNTELKIPNPTIKTAFMGE